MAKPPAEVDLLSSALLEGAVAPPEHRPEPLIPKGALWFIFLSPPFLTVLTNPDVFSARPEEVARRMLSTFLVTAGIGALLWLFYGRVLPRLFLTATGPVARAGLHGAAILLSVIGGLAMYAPLMPWVGRQSITSLVGWLPCFYVAVVVASGFVLIVLTYERLRRQARAVEQREQHARSAALAAQLAALQARTNPHFLFNSLNAMAGLIQEDPDRAEQMVERMADLFRYTLDGSRRRHVPLSQELSMVRDYLEIESIRLGDRLRWSVDVGPGIDAVPVPPLVLQPLVENAIRHGVSPRREGGSVEVEVRRDEDVVVLRVIDDGPGPGNSTHTGSGTSMRDLRKRLRLIYGDDALLETREGDGGGCVVEVTLPPSPEAA